MALIVIYVAVIALTYLMITVIKEFEKREERLERMIEDAMKTAIKAGQKIDGVQKDVEAVAQVAWNASNKSTTNSKKIARMQGYES